jgi:GxxExxY protein
MGKSYFDGVQEMRDPQTYAIIGAAMEVHRELGRGFLEACYCEALKVEFEQRSIPFQSESKLKITYKGRELPCTYRADFVCFESVIVEVKALGQLTGVERSQAIHYLKATSFKVALLLNFGTDSLQYERIVLNY